MSESTAVPRKFARQVGNNWFTRQFVPAQAMATAVKDLLGAANRYTVVLKRSPFDWRSGSDQERYVVLTEEDPVEFDGMCDERFSRAREVTVLLFTADGGAAQVSLTYRRWETFAPSPRLSQALHTFDQRLRASGRSWLLTSSASLYLLGAALAWFVLCALLSALFDPTARSHLLADKPLPPPSSDDVFVIVAAIGSNLLFWPSVVLGVVVAVLRMSSGGLRVWPEALTLASMRGGLYRLRSGVRWATHISTIVVAVTTTLITAAAAWVGGKLLQLF